MRKTIIILFLTLSVSWTLAGSGNKDKKLPKTEQTTPPQSGKEPMAESKNAAVDEKGTPVPKPNDTLPSLQKKEGKPYEEQADQPDKGLNVATDSIGNKNMVEASMGTGFEDENKIEGENRDETSTTPASFYTQPDHAQDNGSSGLISWIAFVTSIATLSYLVISKRKTTIASNLQKSHNTSSISREEFNLLDMRINALRSDLQNLTQRVAALNSTTQQAMQQTQQVQQARHSTQNLGSKLQSITLYASMVRDGEFLAMGISSQRTEEASFVITANGNEGTFVVNDDPQVQPRLLSSVKYSVGNAADVEAKASPARQIVTVKPGKVKRVGDAWKIVNRAFVELR